MPSDNGLSSLSPEARKKILERYLQRRGADDDVGVAGGRLPARAEFQKEVPEKRLKKFMDFKVSFT